MNPKLRFKPEQESLYPDYNLLSIRDVCAINREIVDISKEPETQFVEFSMPAFDAGCIPKNIFGNEVKSGRIKIKGDVLLFNKLNVRKKRIWNIHNCPTNSVCSAEFIPVITKNILQDYLYYLVSTEQFTNKVEECSSGTSNSQKRITPFVFVEQMVNVPSKEEQQKIADFFSTIDKKITHIEQNIRLQKNIKTAVTELLLTQILRFNKEAAWELLSINDIAETCGGGTPSTSHEEYWNGSIQWLTPSEINSKYVHASARTITDSGLKNSSAKLLPEGALLLTTRATLGACSINTYKGKVCTNQGFQSLICKSNVVPEFLYYVVTSKAFIGEMFKRASGSTFLEISPKNLKSIRIKLPRVDEQKKIAEFLGVMDEKLLLLERKRTLMLNLKKAFMQQMFV